MEPCWGEGRGGDRLTGNFTLTDTCQGYAELLRRGRPVPGDDAA